MWPFPFCNNPLPQSYNNALSVYEMLCSLKHDIERVDPDSISAMVQAQLNQIRSEFNNFNPVNAILTNWADVPTLSNLVEGNAVISPEGVVYIVASGTPPIAKHKINNSLYLKRSNYPIGYVTEFDEPTYPGLINSTVATYVNSLSLSLLINDDYCWLDGPVNTIVMGGRVWCPINQPKITIFGAEVDDIVAQSAFLYNCTLKQGTIVDGTLTNCGGAVKLTRGHIDNGNYTSIDINGRVEMTHVSCPLINLGGHANLTGCVLGSINTPAGASAWYLNILNCNMTSTVSAPCLNIPRVQHLNITNTYINSNYNGIEITVGTCSAVMSNLVVQNAQADVIQMGEYSKLTLLGCTSNHKWCTGITAAQLNSTPAA